MAAGTVGLHTTAAVPPGQPLRMWFPPDLQLMLHVPFLAPVNIRGKRTRVVCRRENLTGFPGAFAVRFGAIHT